MAHHLTRRRLLHHGVFAAAGGGLLAATQVQCAKRPTGSVTGALLIEPNHPDLKIYEVFRWLKHNADDGDDGTINKEDVQALIANYQPELPDPPPHAISEPSDSVWRPVEMVFDRWVQASQSLLAPKAPANPPNPGGLTKFEKHAILCVIDKLPGQGTTLPAAG